MPMLREETLTFLGWLSCIYTISGIVAMVVLYLYGISNPGIAALVITVTVSGISGLVFRL